MLSVPIKITQAHKHNALYTYYNYYSC